MRVDINNAIINIKNSKHLWDTTIAPTLPQPDNLQGSGVGASDISKAFEEIRTLLNVISESDIDGVAWTVNKGNFDGASAALAQILSAYGGSPADIVAQIPNICSWLWSLKTAALQLIPIHPEAASLSPDFKRVMSGKIAEANAWFEEVEALRARIDNIQASAQVSLDAIQLQQSQSGGSVRIIQELLAKIEGHEREASTAKTNASSSASNANTEATAVAKIAQDLTDSVDIKIAIFKEFGDRRDEISGLLENANKVGLARSFQAKRTELTSTWRLWAVAFMCGILGLLALGVFELLPLLEVGALDPLAIISRFLLASPLVWFTWFSARQYGHVLRISEDYAFKEAAAMAFAGYRNEMGMDPEMLKLLQESAIRNFGANPAELLLKRADPASPLHDVFERALEKISPKELMEAVASLIKK